jgi:hypothetical protein
MVASLGKADDGVVGRLTAVEDGGARAESPSSRETLFASSNEMNRMIVATRFGIHLYTLAVRVPSKTGEN